MSEVGFAAVARSRAPLLTDEDIIVYNLGTHEMELPHPAYERFEGLEVPVSGLPNRRAGDETVNS